MSTLQLALQFVLQVAMTLVTTMAAGPLFEWAWRGSAEAQAAERRGASPPFEEPQGAPSESRGAQAERPERGWGPAR